MPDAIVHVLFLCTANSCRSQMAEGLARQLGRGLIKPSSAGLFAVHVHPRAVQVMREIGIDIGSQKSKALDREMLKGTDILITLCDYAGASCPAIPPEIRRIHWPVRDPVGTVGTDTEIMHEFRRSRDEIRGKIEHLIHEIRDQRV